MSSTGPWSDKVRGMVAQTVRAEKRRWVWSQHVVLGEFALPTRGQLWEGQEGPSRPGITTQEAKAMVAAAPPGLVRQGRGLVEPCRGAAMAPARQAEG